MIHCNRYPGRAKQLTCFSTNTNEFFAAFKDEYIFDADGVSLR